MVVINNITNLSNDFLIANYVLGLKAFTIKDVSNYMKTLNRDISDLAIKYILKDLVDSGQVFDMYGTYEVRKKRWNLN